MEKFRKRKLSPCQGKITGTVRYSMENTYRSPASLTTLELLEHRLSIYITPPMLPCKFSVDPYFHRFISVVIVFDVERTKFPLESLQQSGSPSYSTCRSKNVSPPNSIILSEFIKEQSNILLNENLTQKRCRF